MSCVLNEEQKSRTHGEVEGIPLGLIARLTIADLPRKTPALRFPVSTSRASCRAFARGYPDLSAYLPVAII
jgi:hypothetical protein